MTESTHTSLTSISSMTISSSSIQLGQEQKVRGYHSTPCWEPEHEVIA